MKVRPISAVIPTLNRRERLCRTLAGLFAQEVVPAEVIVIDATVPPVTQDDLPPAPTGVRIVVLAPTQRGAAVQRNEGFSVATQPFILFADDDVDPEPGCIEILWDSLAADPRLGGCSAVATNQHYHAPGRVMRFLYRLVGCPATGSLAGRCCGPALNFLPALDPADMPGERVDWMNLCCTLYRREALPRPPLLPYFQGYSLMEDAALALEVGRRWRLATPTRARIYHDTMPASYKDRVFAREKMTLVNHWFVMRRVMGRDSFLWDVRQFAFQAIMLAIPLRTRAGWQRFPAALAGKVAGLTTVLLHGHRWRGYPPIPPA